MKYLAYLNILFGDNHMQKRGDALRTTLVLKIGLKKFLSINFHQKINQVVTLKPPLPFPSRLENKKDKCSHLVIWTFTKSIIRIEKSFLLLVTSYSLSHKQSQLYLFDSGYSLVVLEEGGRGGRRYKRGSDITICFPKHSFLSLLISCLYLSYLTLNSCFVFK
jgi:hypothetical protein